MGGLIRNQHGVYECHPCRTWRVYGPQAALTQLDRGTNHCFDGCHATFPIEFHHCGLCHTTFPDDVSFASHRQNTDNAVSVCLTWEETSYTPSQSVSGVTP